MSSTAAAWLLTYLAHSTVLLAGAWLVARSGALRSVSAREWLWRGALVGGVIGASVQTLAGVRPWTGSAPLPAHVRAAAEGGARTTEPARIARSVAPARGPIAALREEAASGGNARLGDVRLGDIRLGEARQDAMPKVASIEPEGPSRAHDREPSWLALLRDRAPALGMLLLGLWLVALSARARLALGRRRTLCEGPWVAALAELRAAARIRRRVRLTTSSRVATPVAFGLLRPEICVPERALRELPPDLARSALAHELGHLARLDPLWLGVAHLARSLLVVQPLNRLAARELAHLAEIAADEWAARRTGDRLALARCLTEVAGWLRPLAPPLATCAMARRGGRLEERVRRLLDQRGDDTPEGRRVPALSAVALVALAPWALPGWSPLPAAPHPSEGAAGAPRTWSVAARTIDALALELGTLDARLAALPTHDSAHGAELSERVRALSTELTRLRSAIRRGAALDEPR